MEYYKFNIPKQYPVLVPDKDDPKKSSTEERDHPFEGHVVVEVPSLSQRMRLLKETQLFFSPDATEQEKSDLMIDRSSKLMELAEQHIREVHLVHRKTGKEIKTVAALGSLHEARLVLKPVGEAVIDGVPLGESWSPSSSSSATGS